LEGHRPLRDWLWRPTLGSWGS